MCPKMQTLDIKSFQDNLKDIKSVVILMPENPSLDTVAGATSLMLALQEAGKETTIAAPSPMIVEFNRLVGVQKVTDSIDNKNLTISFEEYDATSVERVSYNIENGKFMLVISPKAGTTPPNKDQVIVGYRGVAGELVIVVGAASRDSLGKFAKNEELFNQNTRVAVVGNAPVQNFTQNLELINPQASSISEVVHDILESASLNVTPDIATNLFMGLRAGSDNFQKGITAETFTRASRLLSSGARLEPVTVVNPSPSPTPVVQNTPAEWTQEPRVYKGTTLP